MDFEELWRVLWVCFGLLVWCVVICEVVGGVLWLLLIGGGVLCWFGGICVVM